MMKSMRTLRQTSRRWVVVLACLLAPACLPTAAVAQEPEVPHDSRMEGYAEKMVLEGGNNALTWLGFAFLAAIALLGLFKDAKRTHLD